MCVVQIAQNKCENTLTDLVVQKVVYSSPKWFEDRCGSNIIFFA